MIELETYPLIMEKANEKSPLKSVSLQKNLNLFSGSMFTIGSMIGTGIFISPKGVLLEAGSLAMSLIVWCAAGVTCMLGAFCYMELGTTFPESGSDYTYLRICFGDFLSFLYLWVRMVLSSPISGAVQSLVFANHILEPFFPCHSIPPNALRLTAALVLCLLTYVNCRNVDWVTKVQNVFTFAKVSALIVVISTGMFFLIRGYNDNFKDPFEGTTTEPGRIALSFYSALFAYTGWNFLNCVTEELHDANRNLPRAILLSLSSVMVIYILTNVAYFAVLTPDEIIASNALTVVFGDKILGILSWIMPLLVAVFSFGSVNVHIFSSARLLFVGAREGHLPKVLSFINIHYLTPVPSLIALCLMTMVHLSTTQIYVLINYLSFVDSCFSFLVVGGLVRLRYSQPDIKRPIKVNILFPVLYMLVCLFLIVLPLYREPLRMSIGVLMMLTGVPIYFAATAWQDKPLIYKQISEKITEWLQKLLLSISEERNDSNSPVSQINENSSAKAQVVGEKENKSQTTVLPPK
ncbi:Y+L amino acid transporter 2-like [Uloborus diversus]|uniref:Y+L amino acid transporter 2-like n=1 Tax=Uloborus diversus TaxID=327109 RepID=UPI00240A22D1|nr:Y+L amino acid transporter 2-like [Uloborus diversus]